MLLPWMAGLALRGRVTRRVSASCFALQRAAYTTGPPPQQPSEPFSSSESHSATTPSLDRPTKRKKRQPPLPPQPAPPNPPWPAPHHEAPVMRRKVYTTEKGLTNDVIMTAKISNPRILFPHPAASISSVRPQGPVLSIGVPRPPDFRNDYTNMGPDVVAPWRKGGVFRRVPDRDIKAADGPCSVKNEEYGLRLRYSYSHALHPWSAKYLAASPGVEDADGNSGVQGLGNGSAGGGGGGWPVGFPHSYAEVMRRKYAHRNRTHPLWWFVIVFPDEGDLPTSNLVRNKMRFKLRSAMQTALQQRGYGADGIRLEGEAGAAARYHQMYGSLRVDGPLRPLLDASYDSIVAYLAKGVGVVEGLLGGRESGQPYEKVMKAYEEAMNNKANKKGCERVGSGTRRQSGATKGKPRQNERPDKANKEKDPFAMLLDPSLF